MRKRLFDQISDTAVPEFQASALRLKVCKQGEVTQLLHFQVDHDMKSTDTLKEYLSIKWYFIKGLEGEELCKCTYYYNKQSQNKEKAIQLEDMEGRAIEKTLLKFL